MQPGVVGAKSSELLEIPPDIVLDLPRVTMVGNIEITLKITGNRGYTPARLRLATQGEQLCPGTSLFLSVWLKKGGY